MGEDEIEDAVNAYWFSDSKVSEIADAFSITMTELKKATWPAPVVEIHEASPDWSAWDDRYNLTCPYCQISYEVKSRQAYNDQHASCPNCNHKLSTFGGCKCKECLALFEVERENRQRQRDQEQKQYEEEHICAKCNELKEDVTPGAFADCRICRDCFEKYYNQKLLECWGSTGDATKSIFDSEPERWTFSIIRQSYPNLILIPNAALLSFISLEAIESSLTKAQTDYLYKGRVDLLVVEPANFKPVLAIELDSSWHDDERIQQNDKRKEKILSLAGVPLERFRQNGFSTFGEIEKVLNLYFGRANAEN